MENKIKRYLNRNIRLYNKCNKKCLRQRSRVYQENVEKLKEIYSDFCIRFNNLNNLAFEKCSLEAFRRRMGDTGFFISFDYEILMNYYYIDFYDPDLVDFPLRFLVHLPLNFYKDLQNKWKETKNKDEIIKIIDCFYLKSDLFEIIKSRCKDLENIISSFRLDVIKELKICFEKEYYTSATLLSVTQTEGILWDFAKYLNRKNIRIFKIKGSKIKQRYYPYEWDYDNKKYKNLKASGYPEYSKREILSARMLLEKTRLGEYFYSQVYNYLIDEFYDERCDLAHGNLLSDRNTALKAILCLYSVLLSIKISL
jgi:hypothetical protein